MWQYDSNGAEIRLSAMNIIMSIVLNLSKFDSRKFFEEDNKTQHTDILGQFA